MSCDLMVFEKTKSPRKKEEFLSWYEEQTQWHEDHGYDDPAVSSPALQKFFEQIRTVFPPMNGPWAPSDKELLKQPELDNYLCDYCIGREVIYLSLPWARAKEAYDIVKRAAFLSGAGFFDTNGNGQVFFPDERQAMLLEGQWFEPMEAKNFSLVKEMLSKMTAENKSWLCLTDMTGSYIQAGGGCGAFTVERRRYTSLQRYEHKKADKQETSARESSTVLITGNRVKVQSSQILSLEEVCGLFQDFFERTETKNIFWQEMFLQTI